MYSAGHVRARPQTTSTAWTANRHAQMCACPPRSLAALSTGAAGNTRFSRHKMLICLLQGCREKMGMQSRPIIGSPSIICKMPYHDKDDAQEAHGASGIRLLVLHVLNQPYTWGLDVSQWAMGRKRNGESKWLTRNCSSTSAMSCSFTSPLPTK
jgi:hypothetical protein